MPTTDTSHTITQNQGAVLIDFPLSSSSSPVPFDYLSMSQCRVVYGHIIDLAAKGLAEIVSPNLKRIAAWHDLLIGK